MKSPKSINIIQHNPYDLKLVLYSGKTKCMVFSNARHVNNHVIATLAGHTIEQFKVYIYLGVWIDKMSFTVHVENLITKLKLKIDFITGKRLVFLLKPGRSWYDVYYWRF